MRIRNVILYCFFVGLYQSLFFEKIYVCYNICVKGSYVSAVAHNHVVEIGEHSHSHS